jgi:hypothetical protein
MKMSGDNSIIPINDEQAKAIQEALKALQGPGGFLEKTLGTAPADIVALLGGNWLKVRRAENLYRILEKSRERLKARHIEPPEPPSLSRPAVPHKKPRRMPPSWTIDEQTESFIVHDATGGTLDSITKRLPLDAARLVDLRESGLWPDSVSP